MLADLGLTNSQDNPFDEEESARPPTPLSSPGVKPRMPSGSPGSRPPTPPFPTPLSGVGRAAMRGAPSISLRLVSFGDTVLARFAEGSFEGLVVGRFDLHIDVVFEAVNEDDHAVHIYEVPHGDYAVQCVGTRDSRRRAEVMYRKACKKCIAAVRASLTCEQASACAASNW